ncbi:acetate kinase [candidate division KSB1 bacterium 4484_87]|nr:MAG: acetate kinase [candidate division KSB1 bacterium 4484_87]
MKVLVLNSGSSSVKYQLFNGNDLSWLVRGSITRIGKNDAECWQERKDGHEVKYTLHISDHEAAIDRILQSLLSKKSAILSDISELYAVGHRVVHGGEYFSQPTLISDDVIEKIEECSQLAPLHNPPQIAGIRACQKLIPGIPQVAVFDTAFHQTIPQYAFMYALPYEFYEKYRIRRYGFHGTSHYYVAKKAAELAEIDFNKSKIITCHLGNGSSMAAIHDGVCVDTSMGFTPLEGLVMGTRTGDIDASAVLFLMRQENLTAEEMDEMLNKKSGVLGLSSYSNDMQKVLQRADTGDKRSELAIDVFTYRVKKYIGAYAAALNGVDLLVFTAGIGENAPLVRSKICKDLDFIGLRLDHFVNQIAQFSEVKISRDDSAVQVWVVPTNEESVIASQTLDVIYEMQKD